ncbi:hypothetical protein GKZ89_16020 [Bacillus mangrovi]|uniref:Uncharacterized protein n=1 Tax=Metabacillus mangrovi TaxID=1491830 RepID=A0A7X2S7W5_9BACI|nr:hypothetical protein [Metabacillus mangrovi]MTH54910.1 hypothetical protein [Metabacillus mangrovi]
MEGNLKEGKKSRKRCKTCRRKPGIETRWNSDGILFCSDDCYEDYEGSPNDFSDPYIDDYEAIRRIYIEWMQAGDEDGLSNGDLIELIDEILFDFRDYYRLEGSDGIFSEQIYHYLLTFEEMQEELSGERGEME